MLRADGSEGVALLAASASKASSCPNWLRILLHYTFGFVSWDIIWIILWGGLASPFLRVACTGSQLLQPYVATVPEGALANGTRPPLGRGGGEHLPRSDQPAAQRQGTQGVQHFDRATRELRRRADPVERTS